MVSYVLWLDGDKKVALNFATANSQKLFTAREYLISIYFFILESRLFSFIFQFFLFK